MRSLKMMKILKFDLYHPCNNSMISKITASSVVESKVQSLIVAVKVSIITEGMVVVNCLKKLREMVKQVISRTFTKIFAWWKKQNQNTALQLTFQAFSFRRMLRHILPLFRSKKLKHNFLQQKYPFCFNNFFIAFINSP